MKKINIIKGIVFLAAFLLFQIELIVAKILLPSFGGGYAVWGAAVVFFQATLFASYLYSHLVIKKFGIFKYRYIHLGLMALTLLFFPGRHFPSIGPIPHLPMGVNVFFQLLFTIGVSFFFLSTTSIIFQSWLASSELKEKANPYTLYGVSNFGSLAALLTYPIFFELVFDLNIQLSIWRVAYFVLVALSVLAFGLIRVGPSAQEEPDLPAQIRNRNTLKWLLLGAAGVMMFLSITNILTYEIMPMPLLWVIPLAIYLISFTLNFKKTPWCPAWIKEKFHIVVALSVVMYFFMTAHILSFGISLVVYLILLFAACMFCQSELYMSRPQDKSGLTLFYLVLSLGGFLGGIVVSWIVPLIFSSVVEYLLGLLVIYAALIIDRQEPLFDRKGILPIVSLIAVLIVWPLIFWEYNVFGVIFIGWVFYKAYSKLKSRPFMSGLSLLLIVLFAISPFTNILWSKQKVTRSYRDYYGVYKISRSQEKVFLTNGNTMHGGQYTTKEREREPLLYYHYATPVGKLFLSSLFGFNRIGAIGLGAGTMAVYGKPGQTIDFFELDPKVYEIATKYFTYLKNCQAKTNFIFGDARISLKKSPENYYDILLVDAFSGDYIPAHLLTTNAIEEYRKHLTAKGMILFHISSQYLALRPMLFADAKAIGAYACAASNRLTLEAASSEWVALTWDKDVFDVLISRLKWTPAPDKLPAIVRPWTDMRTNIMSILRAGYLINQIKTFQPLYWNFNISSDKMRDLIYYKAQGGQLMLDNNFNQAVGYYKKALELNPDDAPALRSLGNAYYLSGQYNQAITAYKKSLKVDPSDAVTLRGLGKLYTQQGLYNDAVICYKKSLEINPNNPATLLWLANVCSSLGRDEEALGYYKKAVELDPNAYNAVLAYRLQQSVLRYKEALKANPKDTGVLLNLGNAYYFLRQYNRAVEAYQNVINIKPDDESAIQGLGDTYYAEGDSVKAIEYYMKVAALKPPGSAAILEKIGRAYAKDKAYPQALDYYNKSLAIDATNPLVYLDVSTVYIKLKRLDKFKENMLKARKLFQDKNDANGIKLIDDLLKKTGA